MEETAVRAAVKTGDVATLQALLDKGVHLDAKDQDGRTPLHWACASGRLNVAEFLLARARASLDVQDDAGWTPLMSAASAGHAEIVGLLLVRWGLLFVRSVGRSVGLCVFGGGV